MHPCPPSQPAGLNAEESESETVDTSQKVSHTEDPDDEDELEREMLAAFEGGEYDSQVEDDAPAESG